MGRDYAMKKQFTEEQIALALKQAEYGTPAAEVIRKMGGSSLLLGCPSLTLAVLMLSYGFFRVLIPLPSLHLQ